MNLDMIVLKIRNLTDIEELRQLALTMIKTLNNDVKGGGYCVVNDHFASHKMFSGSREECIAYVEGYESAPLTDVGCFDTSSLCVCVECESLTIIIPEERFGERLIPDEER